MGVGQSLKRMEVLAVDHGVNGLSPPRSTFPVLTSPEQM
jgi:hypothetical protein